ncbi:MAG: aromatic ring-hydroxylating dioxygenase subunit alpha [Rhodospirillaceae bacterium]|jgi:nitrite reductase/ring-hydroxylating ferredoxin subunit
MSSAPHDPVVLSDAEAIDRIFHHIDHKTTDTGEHVWREPVEHYFCEQRFLQEQALMRRLPIPFCPSGALLNTGDFLARRAAGTPLLAVRGRDGQARVFRNTCRHRGMPVASGSGCARAFICPYHAWTYDLDGKLTHVSGKDGFPDLDTAAHGLLPVAAVEERGGLIWVTQDAPISDGALAAMPDLFTPEQQVFDMSTFTDPTNWKLAAETSMEGYHIKALHKESFYPFGFDNLNVVETFGPNSRIIFPFRRIEKLRQIPPAERRLQGMVTDVFQLFPNTHVSVLSHHSHLIILEPVAVDKTEYVFFRLSNRGGNAEDSLARAKKDAAFLKDGGLTEDREAANAIYEGLKTGANDHLTFGRFEKAIGHFHASMAAMLSRHSASLNNNRSPLES